MKRGRATLWGRTIHEFRKGLRVLEADVPRLELLKSLVERKRRETNYLAAETLILLLGVLVIANCAEDGAVFLPFEIDLPLSYAVFFLSVVFSGAACRTQGIFLLNAFERALVKRSYGFDNRLALTVPFDSASVVNLATQTRLKFVQKMQSRRYFLPVRLLSSLINGLVLVPVMVVNLFTFFILLLTAVSIYRVHPVGPLEMQLNFASLCLLIAPFASAAMNSIPFKLR